MRGRVHFWRAFQAPAHPPEDPPIASPLCAQLPRVGRFDAFAQQVSQVGERLYFADRLLVTVLMHWRGLTGLPMALLNSSVSTRFGVLIEYAAPLGLNTVESVLI
jgi:hypothetical protein